MLKTVNYSGCILWYCVQFMSYWIFIVTRHKEHGLTADEIFRQRMADKFWGLGEKTQNRSSLRKGDQVVYYVGLPAIVFVGSAVLASDSWRLSEEERDRVSHGTEFYRAEYGVRLDQIQVWHEPRPVKGLVPHLKFIENKEFWFAYFQGGVREISEEDFRTITLGVRASELPRSASAEEIESASEFALEAHLEEFMDKNWENINFGTKLVRYQNEDQSGRQFPAGPWSIDFLCTESESDDFVVVELKKGKTSDAAVGQILRYMGWVKKHVAKEGQKVKGVIIAKEVDEALKYAVQNLKDVSVSTYEINFRLTPFKE
jgi:predicted RNA-binding protein